VTQDQSRWTAVLPVYNEAAYLPATLASLIAQARPPRVLLVDNGSTDGCIDAARAQLAASPLEHEIIREPRPGQVHALAAGLARLETEFVAVCDADTLYPPHYLAAAERLFEAGGERRVMAAAWLRPERGSAARHALARAHRLAAARLLPRQNHTSGAAQCFRSEALRRAGGYDARRWPFVLKDHELAHRMLKLGTQAYAPELWCISSARRASRRHVRWTLSERLLYHATPFALKDWFFYTFLAARFTRRGQRDTVLRQRAWDQAGEA
jgi:glycosyltransferase involved in cell wall biosynthesis